MTRDATRPVRHFLTALLARDAPPCAVRIARSGAVVARRADAAFDSASRRKGLLGRDGLESDAALIIAPCSAIHTWGMRFPIDVLFVDRRGTVLKLYRNLRPWKIGVALRAFAAIECAAGAIDGAGVVVGDRLTVAPVSVPD